MRGRTRLPWGCTGLSAADGGCSAAAMRSLCGATQGEGISGGSQAGRTERDGADLEPRHGRPGQLARGRPERLTHGSCAGSWAGGRGAAATRQLGGLYQRQNQLLRSLPCALRQPVQVRFLEHETPLAQRAGSHLPNRLPVGAAWGRSMGPQVGRS